MKATNRPEQIETILNSLDAADEMVEELERYIADLEAKQPDRPSRVTGLLQEVEARYSAEARVTLEAYISELEANQQPVPSNNAPNSQYDPDNPPRWSHQRAVEREQRRWMRAQRKQDNYQLKKIVEL